MQDLFIIIGLTILLSGVTALGWGIPRLRSSLPLRPKLPPDTQYVDETDSGKLYIEIAKWCPDCHHKPPRYMEGPSGGCCTNIFCGDCGAGFNITPMVEVAERIGKQERYIQKESTT